MAITISAKTIVNNLTIGPTPAYFTIPTNNLTLYLDASNSNSYPGTGTVWYDLSLSGNTCYITGATFNSLGSKSSIDFNGTNNYVRVPYGNSPNFFWTSSATSWTISFWMKTSQTNGATIYGETGGGTGPTDSSNGWAPMIYLRTDGKLRMELWWSGNINNNRIGNTVVNDNKYHNIIAIRSGTTQTIYVDGVLDVTPLTVGVAGNYGYHWIGSGVNSGRGLGSNVWYNGSINNFIIYKRALTQTEITSLYNTFRPKFL